LQLADGSLTTVGGAVVHDPKDAAGVAVGRLGHHLLDEAINRGDARLGLTAAEEFGVVDIPGCQIGPGPAALVLVFDPHGGVRWRRQRGMAAAACLNAGLLVGAENKLLVVQRLVVPAAVIEIEDASRLGRELGVPGKNSAAMHCTEAPAPCLGCRIWRRAARRSGFGDSLWRLDAPEGELIDHRLRGAIAALRDGARPPSICARGAGGGDGAGARRG